MAWAHRLGLEGRDFRAVRDTEATVGKLAHAGIEAKNRNKPFEWIGPPEIVARAKKSYGACLEWMEQTRLTVTHAELSLVSERYHCGGTFDAIMLGKRRIMADFKTSSGIYPESLIQVAAYGGLWNEAHPEEPVEGYSILRFDKQYGDFHVHQWAELDAAWEAFLHLRALYDLEKVLKVRAR